MDLIHNVGQIVTAVGGLGTAAFGLVDATKVFWGGVNHVGFSKIKKRIVSLVPAGEPSQNALPQQEVIRTLQGNWFNGTDLSAQKAIAKSLVKLHLNAANAKSVAVATNLDTTALTAIVENQAAAKSLAPDQADLYARFDLIVTAMLDETYQLADQDYRNATRALATVFSVLLSLAGWLILTNGAHPQQVDFWTAVVVGLLATPLAPIAKDLSTALATAVNALQAAKK
jgi:hypothetical protein